jgi:hypothetical protein
MILTSFVNYLKNDVPRHTNAFTDQLSISSISATNNVVTVVTNSAHKLITGHYVTMTGAKKLRAVASLTRVGNLVTLTTVGQHNYTQGYNKCQYITVKGATPSAYNGTFLVKEVLSGTRITYEIPTTDPMPITPATGTITIDEERKSINGSYQVTVTNGTTFAFNSPNAASDVISGEPVVHVRHRITGYLKDLDTFLEYLRTFDNGNPFYSYEKPWLLVIPEGTRTNKNKNSRIDTSDVVMTGETIRIGQIHGASIMTLYNTKLEHAFSVSVHDVAVADISKISRSVLGYKPPASEMGESISGFSINSHGPAVVGSNRYVHAMSIDYVSHIVFADTSRAFKQDYAINEFDFDLTKGDPTITAAGYIP